jgi:HAD superfamily hydrolase (TIGR01450 family)
VKRGQLLDTPVQDLIVLLANKTLYLLDMDGTLYLGEKLFPCALPFLQAVREGGADYLFLTNNSSRGSHDYVEKLNRMGIRAREEDFFTSAHAAVVHLKHHCSCHKIYVLGTASFKAQLEAAGLPITDRMEEGIDCLLLGYDTELTYRKLADASMLLLQKELIYLATNPDWVCPTAFGYVPDCGAIAQALEHATGRLPRFLGKPDPAMALLAMESKGVKPHQTVLIGDRIYTDIACGQAAGAATILVFSGETTREDCQNSRIQPDAKADNVGLLTLALQAMKENP